jgi:hypothetical protein
MEITYTIFPLLSNNNWNNDNWLEEAGVVDFPTCLEKADKMGIFWKTEALRIS